MSLVFHYSPHSSAVTVHWALEELGVPYEKVKVDLQARDQERPAFLALNPNGKVPVLVHDGTPIFESAAIVIHLGETFGVAKKLFPAPGLERARALSWLVWTNASLNEGIAGLMKSAPSNTPAEQHDAKAAAEAREALGKLLGIVDEALDGRSFFLGESFSLVDVHVAGWVSYAGMVGADLAAHPRLEAWVKRCQARPAFGIAMAP